MKVIVAPDSYKGSLSASTAADAIAAGVLAASPDLEVIKLPLADGGEGTVNALVNATGGTLFTEKVHGPLGEWVEAEWGILGDGKTAVIEMAAASGLELVPTELRNPLITSTYGMGELLRAAAQRGVQRVIVGVGGSATNDGGAGAMQALGARLLNSAGQELGHGGAALADLARIDMSKFIFPNGIDVQVACDVDNLLTGPDGASYTYGPQKGADQNTVKLLDSALQHYAQVIHRDLDMNIKSLKGAGAAGGLAGGLAAFLNAELKPGIDIVLDAVRFDDQVKSAHLIITGEGRIDSQTLRGKTIAGVLRRARQANVPVVALAGAVEEGAENLYDAGAVALLSIVDRPMSEQEAFARATELLGKTAHAIISLWLKAQS